MREIGPIFNDDENNNSGSNQGKDVVIRGKTSGKPIAIRTSGGTVFAPHEL